MKIAAGKDRMKLLKSKTHFLLAIVLCAVWMSSTVFSQQTPVPPAPQPVPVVKAKEKEKEKEKIKTPMPAIPGALPPGVEMGDGTTTERSIAVDQKVSIQMCVTQGTVRINGWNRNEVRAFVSEGSTFGFHVAQKSMKDGSPVLISLVNIRKTQGGMAMAGDCIAGDEIEIDAPENASVSLRGRQTDISIDSIRKVWIANVGGDINIQNVSQGIRATTGQGDVTVENSQGAIVLESSSGNIVAYGVEPSEVGDQFKAKTNSGAISLQKLGYRLADINSISGTVLFTGGLLSGGTFSFTTTNGSIRLMLPDDTSCRVTATYGYGSFDSTLPLKTLTNDVHPGPIKTVNGAIGAGGDATLRLTTNTGSIQIRKLQP
jgi:hypothetical protein